MARRPFAALVATRVLYMEERRGQDPDPCYAREFDARILERGPDFVVLDQTLFYAEGGGQPDDTGTLRWEGGEARVLRVTKEKGVVKHHVDRMPAAEEVHGAVEWDRRYKHMRMHTSQHLMSGLVFRTYGARTVGNQIHMDYSRVDFQPANFTPEDLKRIEDDCNRVIASSQDVRIFEEDRVVVQNKIEDRALLHLIPQSVRRLRVIEIGSAVGFARAREGPWDELILVDAVPDLAWAQAEDIRHGLRVSTQPTVRVGKIEDLADCDVVVLSAGQGRKPEMTRLDLLHANAGLVANLSRDIARVARRASLVVLTNPMDVMTTIAWQSTGWPRTRVLGSGTLLDSQRFRTILADLLNVPSVKISATVLGEHGERVVPVFTRAKVGGRRPTLSAKDKEEITRRLRDVSTRVIAAKGGTAFGPAGATVELVHALIGSRPRVVPCSVVLEGEYGVHGVAIGVPAVLGTGRVLALEEWPLADDERTAFEEAARDLKAFAEDAEVLLKANPRPSG